MAGVVDYASLKTEIGNFLHRTDLTTELDTLIQLAEADFNRVFRFRSMLVTTNPVSSANLIALPSDYLEMRNIELQGSPIINLKYVTNDQKELYDGGTSTGTPRMYSVSGPNIVLIPTPDTAYTANLTYYQRIPTLVGGANTTNWLIAQHPDIYLFGALQKSALYIGQDPRMADWVQTYGSAVQIAKEIDSAGLYTGGSIITRPDVRAW